MVVRFQRSQRLDILVDKAADETVNNSAVMQNDDELLMAVKANEKWVFILTVLINSGTTPDIQVGWSVPSGTTIKYGTPDANPQPAIAESATPLVATSGADQVLTLIGEIDVGSTAGNVNFQWAQNTQDASDTKVLARSVLHAWRAN